MFDHPELIVFVAIYDVAVLVALGLLAWACVTDFLSMTIPNAVSLGLIAAFAVAFCTATLIGLPAFDHWKVHGAALIAMFVVTFFMFVFRIWGAGDSKMATGVAFWIGLQGFATFIVVMSLAGMGLVLLSYVLRKAPWSYARLGERSWPAQLKAGAQTVPYGIAIAFGAIWTFFSLGYLDLYGLMQGIP